MDALKLTGNIRSPQDTILAIILALTKNGLTERLIGFLNRQQAYFSPRCNSQDDRCFYIVYDEEKETLFIRVDFDQDEGDAKFSDEELSALSYFVDISALPENADRVEILIPGPQSKNFGFAAEHIRKVIKEIDGAILETYLLHKVNPRAMLPKQALQTITDDINEWIAQRKSAGFMTLEDIAFLTNMANWINSYE